MNAPPSPHATIAVLRIVRRSAPERVASVTAPTAMSSSTTCGTISLRSTGPVGISIASHGIRLGRRLAQTIAEPADRLDHRAARAELLAEGRDVDVDRSIDDGRVAAERAFDDIVARQHAAAPAGEEVEDAEFGGGERDTLAGIRDVVAGRVDRELAPAEDFALIRRLRRPSQRRADAGEQLAHAERLCDVVVAAHFQSNDFIALFRLGGKDDDGDSARAAVGTQALADLQPVH